MPTHRVQNSAHRDTVMVVYVFAAMVNNPVYDMVVKRFSIIIVSMITL